MAEQGKKHTWIKTFLWLFLGALLVFGTRGSNHLAVEPIEATRALADGMRFGYSSWTLGALFNKAVSASLKAERFLNDEQQTMLAEAYFDQVGLVEQKENELADLINRLGQQSNATLKANEALLIANERLNALAGPTEAIIQSQTERSLLAMGFGVAGQLIPPVLYQVSDLPLNLIVSPRDEIKTLLGISLEPGMTDLEKFELEEIIFSKHHFSALIEEVGGVGVYPTMVMRSNNINWLTETVAHEWIHNYLSLRPLGIRYFQNNEMRTINETTATLSGKEIGRALIQTFYPKRIVTGFYPPRRSAWVPTIEEMDLFGFDYRKEMHQTRLHVDSLLSKGQIEAAEAYMNQRQKLFWEEGYRIRKINQAFFAFYGSYSDTPGGGASGEDPVGPAVRALRYSQPHLKKFIDTIQKVRSFADLLKIVP